MKLTDKDFKSMNDDLDNKPSDKAKAYYLRDKAREANNLPNNHSSYLLMYIQEIHSRSFWQEDWWEYDKKDDSFREWAKAEIGPIYNDGTNIETTLAIAIRIIENIMPYANKHKLPDNNGKSITPKYLLKNVGIGRLKIVSNLFKDNVRTDLRNEIIVALTTDITDDELRERYTKRPPHIQYAENFHPDTGTDIFIFGLNEKQVKTLKNALRKLAVHHSFSLDSTNREAILNLLPSSARQQNYFEGYDSEVEN